MPSGGDANDVFGMSAERRLERALIAEYRVAVEQTTAGLAVHNFDQAMEALAAADEVRGYGPVKLKAIERYRPRFQAALARFALGASDDRKEPANA